MAWQQYSSEQNTFTLDLHGVLARDARRVVQKRITECFRYGIRTLRIIYGTPEIYDGSIGYQVRMVVEESTLIEKDLLPYEFVSHPNLFCCRVPAVSLPIAPNRLPAVQGEGMAFVSFRASRERDRWKRRLCETTFTPLKPTFLFSDIEKFANCNLRDEMFSGLVPTDFQRWYVRRDELQGLVNVIWGRASGRPRTTLLENKSAPKQDNSCELGIFDLEWEAAMRAWSEQKTSVQRAHLENCWHIVETHAAESELLPLTLFALGRCAEAQEDLKDAYLFFRLASDWHTERAKPASRLWADITLALATVLECQDKLGEAASAYGDAHAHLLAAGDIEAAVSALKNQAELTAELGHWESAERQFRQLLGILQDGRAGASDLISDVYVDLGRILKRLSRESEALGMCEQAVKAAQDQSSDTVHRALLLAAEIHDHDSRPDAARELLNRIVKDSRHAGRVDLPYIDALLNLGLLFLDEGDTASADEYCRSALAELTASGLDAPYKLYWTHYWIAEIAKDRDDLSNAAKHFSAAVEAIRGSEPYEFRAILDAKEALAQLYSEEGRILEAENLFEECLEIAEILPNSDLRYAEICFEFGVHSSMHQEFARAEGLFRRALKIQEQSSKCPVTAIVDTLSELGDVLLAKERWTQARPVCKRLLDTVEASLPRDGDQLRMAYGMLGRALIGMGQTANARRMFARAEMLAPSGADHFRLLS